MDIDQPRCSIVPVPKINRFSLFFCGLCNIILPGVGTMIGACIENAPYFMNTMWIGISELLMAFIIIGWVWSIIHGCILMVASCSCSDNKKPKKRTKEPITVTEIQNGVYDVKQVKQEPRKANIKASDFTGHPNKL